MEIMKSFLLAFLLFFFTGCSSTHESAHPIARDPTWFPLNFGVRTTNVNGYTNALFQKLSLPFIDVAWNQLFRGLNEGEFAGILTSLPPNPITIEKYDFSEPFLLLGPVLVVPIDSTAHSLSELDGATIGVYQYDESVLIAQEYPDLVIELYESVPIALKEVVRGTVNAALVPNLEAALLVSTLYADQLRIATPPLNDKGLRLITLKGEHPELIKRFNKGISQKGELSKLQKTFGLHKN